MSIATLLGRPEIGAGMVATVAATVFVTGALKWLVGRLSTGSVACSAVVRHRERLCLLGNGGD